MNNRKENNFHQTLYKLSKHISSEILHNLKYMCKDVMDEAKLNSIVKPLDLFQALEECGKLSVYNTQYLADLLETEGTPELIQVLNSIGEQSQSFYTAQQPIHGMHYVYDDKNAAALPLCSVEEEHHSMPLEAGTRDASTHRPSVPEVLPLSARQFMPVVASTPQNTVRLVGEQRQWQLAGNIYSEPSYEREDFTRYNWNESSPVQLVQPNFEVSHSYVSTTNEKYHPTSMPAKQEESGLIESLSANNSDLSAFSTTVFTQNVNQQEDLALPTQVVDDDSTTACPWEITHGNLSIPAQTVETDFQRWSTILHEHQVHQLELNNLKEKLQYYEEKQVAFQQLTIERFLGASTRFYPQYNVMGEAYQMDRNPHGIAVIINNYKFHSTNPADKPMPNRRGSQVDENSLCCIWKYLQYDVLVLKNCTASELIFKLEEIASQSHVNYDSFVCCILSHGCHDEVYGSDSKPVKINDIASLFEGKNCPTLTGKPKLFFIQACRGENEDQGVFLDHDEIQKDGKDDNKDPYYNSLPSDADFLLGFATPPGKVSWRSQQYGSWYISELCKVLHDRAHFQDLLSMLTIVNDEVSKAYTRQGYKQCPAPVTLLRKQVWFFKSYYMQHH